MLGYRQIQGYRARMTPEIFSVYVDEQLTIFGISTVTVDIIRLQLDSAHLIVKAYDGNNLLETETVEVKQGIDNVDVSIGLIKLFSRADRIVVTMVDDLTAMQELCDAVELTKSNGVWS